MRRVQLVLAALAIVVASFAAISGPAMADDWNNNRGDDSWNNQRWDDNWNNNWRWNNNEDNNWWGWNNWNSNWWWNNNVQDCPFWGDTSGVVNQWDCFD
jgi:hypothetical protein